MYTITVKMNSNNVGNHRINDTEDTDETSKLLQTIPPGISARTHSISGTRSTVLEKPEVYKSRWRSIRVMYLTMFLSSISFSICMSSLYPYLKILDKTANTDFLGWVVAAYSLGQLIASPIFGAWSNLRGKAREPLVTSLTINILANVLYMYLENIHTHSKIFLILARALVGFGAGNVAVVRSYVSGATTLNERTSAMANMSAFQAVGFIIGPLIQTALVPMGYPGLVHTAALHLDMYTSTAFLSALVGVVNVVLVVVVFREHTVKDDILTQESIQYRSIEVPAAAADDDVRPLDYLAVISSIALFFSVLFVFAIFETIATPLSMHMFGWTKAMATLYVGAMLGVAGIVSILVFVVIKILSKRFNERFLLLGGFIMCMLGFLVYLPWGHTYPAIQAAEIDTENTTSNHTNGESTGCPYVYKWCFDTPAIKLWQFLLGTFFVAIGYPTCNVMSYTIYSKILGPKPQGVWMGWLTAAGSLARTLGPVFVSEVYDATGPRVTFSAIIGFIFFTVIGYLIVFRRLVPFAMTRTVNVTNGS